MLRRLLYRFYEWRLASTLRAVERPQHVGIILDGNRRFARRQGFADAADGHRRGADKAEELLAWCDDLEIPIVTVWALSTDNFRRDPEELGAIFSIVEDKIAALVETQTTSRRRRVRAVGRTELLPESTRAAIANVEASTADYGPHELMIAVGYGGREEITDAVRRLIAQRVSEGASLEGIVDGLNPDAISAYMYAPDVPDPDLIIRTSGELRLSGFLLWQSAYSEFYFCDVYWPEFRRIDFLRALRSYGQRQRRRGS
ncbi:MAG: polyprenyl diphosphate synthase [Dehalococcoidia bacterium]